MITPEDRARLGDLAASALDDVAEYGDEAQLEDAALIYEISMPYDEAEDAELAQRRWTQVLHKTTTHRAVVVIGLADTLAAALKADYVHADDEDEE